MISKLNMPHLCFIVASSRQRVVSTPNTSARSTAASYLTIG